MESFPRPEPSNASIEELACQFAERLFSVCLARASRSLPQETDLSSPKMREILKGTGHLLIREIESEFEKRVNEVT
jgi:hypothetical protein